MSQHDMIIDNAAGTSVRADLNLALQALASTSSGTSAPGTPYAGQLWWDTNTPSTSRWTLFCYDGTDWIEIGQMDTSANVFYAAATNAAQDTNTTQVASTAFVINQSASQAVMEAAASFTRFVSPGRQQLHPSAAKAWVRFAVSGGVVTLGANYNVASVVRNSTGNYTVNFTTPFSSATYCAQLTAGTAGIGFAREASTLPTASAYTLEVSNNTGGALADPAYCHAVFYGDQ